MNHDQVIILCKRAAALNKKYLIEIESFKKREDKHRQKVINLRNEISDLAIAGYKLGMSYRGFSNNSKIAYSTLMNWVNERRKPIDQFRKDKKLKYEKVDESTLNAIKSAITLESTSDDINNLYDNHIKKSVEDLALDRFIREGEKMLEFANSVDITQLQVDLVLDFYSIIISISAALNPDNGKSFENAKIQ